VKKEQISDKYYNEALKLRKDYADCVKILNEKSPFLTKYKEELEEIKNRISSVDVSDETKAEKEILKEVQIIDNKLLVIQKELKPVYDVIEELQRKSDMLYDAITEKYPKLTTDDIKQQLWEKVKHIII
jgi:Mg2+ and Co2+ transporter CorA